jgi:hypothetical protein
VSGVFVASTVVTLMHWLRVRDRRLVPLMGMLAMLAAAQSLEWWHPWRHAFELAAAAGALVLMSMLRGPGGDLPVPSGR